MVGSDVSTPDFNIECKHGKKPSPRAALEQCERDNPEPRDRWPLAVIKDNQVKPGVKTDPFICMRLDNFLELLHRMEDLIHEVDQ